ncbi:Glycosyl hydrolases family 31 [Popillia japonica]|uniref:Glucosidase II subunit alpha n=1 Tax=Popillia japonica TaxID=7064 RepID=A0AAW1I854_POPJA
MFSFLPVLALLATAHSWYTCDEVEFCSNIRYNYNIGSYSLTNIEVDTSVTGNLINEQTAESFSFTFTALVGDTFRLTVQDADNSRYTPKDDVLDGTPTEQSLTLVSISEDLLILSVDDDLSVYLYVSPFYIEVLRDDQVIIEINKANRLIINTADEDKSLSLDISFPIANTAYGIPQHAENLSLPSTGPGGLSAYRMFNVDNWGYPAYTREALYGAIGVLYGISTDITSGIFWMNGAQTFIDITNEGDGVDALFISETGALELFLFAGPTLRDCVRQYTTLTGVTPLPQYFTLGYHQCRYSYMSQEDVETVVAEFDNHNFPMDVIWLDIDYSDGYKYFTWNYTAFPDPEGMQNNVAATGRKMVAISDPHIKVEEGYFVYEQALGGDYFVKDSNGDVYEGECWPGLSSYIDYFNPEAQEWYGELYSLENFPNTTLNLYIWNDMNEPSVFEVDELTMPGDLSHYGGIQHRDVHNMYGFKQTQATYAGLLKRDPTKRPFILTRAHFAGSQRYTAMWTGDNSPSWDHLRVSIPMLLSESLAGIAFCGADVGGFAGNVDEELLQRWYQAGVWYPFYRSHSASDTERREPYLYSDEIQERIRSALNIRYAHIPYWYTLFFEHEITGDPIVRPLSYHYPADEAVLPIDEQWLIGSDIMAATVLHEGAESIQTYFPGGSDAYWYDLENNLGYSGEGYYEIAVDMDSAPYYYRSGSLVFIIDDEVRSTEEQRGKSYTLRIFLDTSLQATGNFYFDDLESFDYRNSLYHYLQFTYDYNTNELTIQKLHEDADFDGEFIIDQVEVNTLGVLYSGSDSNRLHQINRQIIYANIVVGKMQSRKTIKL